LGFSFFGFKNGLFEVLWYYLFVVRDCYTYFDDGNWQCYKQGRLELIMWVTKVYSNVHEEVQKVIYFNICEKAQNISECFVHMLHFL